MIWLFLFAKPKGGYHIVCTDTQLSLVYPLMERACLAAIARRLYWLLLCTCKALDTAIDDD